jgi:hypothetical protein
MMHSNYINIKKLHYIPKLMSCRGSHATKCISMEYQHDIHGLDVLLMA